MRKESSVIGEDIRKLAYRVERYLRLEATERLTVLTTVIVLAAATFALATSAIFFFSTGLVKTLTLVTGDDTVSYYMVGAILLLLIVLLFIIGRPLIESRLVKTFSSQLLDGPSITEQVSAQGNSDEQIQRLAESLVAELDEYGKEGGSL